MNNNILLLLIGLYFIMKMCKSEKREQFSNLPPEGTPGKGYDPVNDFNPFDTVNADFSTNGFNQDNQYNQNSVIECQNNYNNLISNNYKKMDLMHKEIFGIQDKIGGIQTKIYELENEKDKLETEKDNLESEKDNLESEIKDQELNIKLNKSNLESCSGT